MTSNHRQLSDLIAYNDWANQVIFAALLDLIPEEWSRQVGGSFGSIQATAGHVVGAEWIWLERWKGHSPSQFPDWVPASASSALWARCQEIAGERREWFRAVKDSSLEKEVSYRLLAGQGQATRLDVLIRHVVNHSTYHRGQLAAFLRTLGKAPPSTDLILWDRQRGDARPDA